jgi:dienelactone hydrolase
VNRGRAALALLVAALAYAAATAVARADTPTTQIVTVEMSDHTLLACGLTLPTGTMPAGGWPGVLLFPGFFQTHAAMDAIAVAHFAPAGLASLACTERGTSGPLDSSDLAGPTDVQDVRDLFNWFAARPDVSDAKIGAFGLSVGGAEVWNAAVAGVPFTAIVPADTWTSLARAIQPYPLKQPLTQTIAEYAGFSVNFTNPSWLLARSSRGKLHSLTVPTFMVQARHDFLFDVDQARAAYRLLSGPKRLYLGNTTPAMPEVTAWLKHYLAGGPRVGGGVEIAPLRFKGLPTTRRATVALPGAATLYYAQVVSRAVRLTGGPFQTFGGGDVTARYFVSWPGAAQPPVLRFVAKIWLHGMKAVLLEGAASTTKWTGVVKIPLLNVVANVPRGKPIVVQLYSTFGDGRFVPAGAYIDLTHLTSTLSFLNRR